MPKSALSAAVARVGRAVAPDGPLLTRYARTRDPDAFAALVERHGPMVLAVCRRTAGDDHLADDAFQAAFLVLARRAADVTPASAVRGWLYGVAVRTAREARAVSTRRRSREVPFAVVPDRPAPPRHEPDADALRALDEEVAALPDHLRAAVVLCELDGLPRADAATRLGVPEGTLSSRLAKARKVLASRLKARGVLPTVGLAALFDRASATAAIGPELADCAAALASGPVPASVADLSRRVFTSMFLTKVKRAAVALLVVAAAVLTGSALWPAKAEPPTPPAVAKAPVGPNRLLVTAADGLCLVDPDAPGLTGKGPALAAAMWGHLSPDGTRLAVNFFGDAPLPEVGHPEFKPTVRTLDKSKPDHVIPKLDPAAPVPPMCSVWSPDGKELIVRQPLAKSNPDGSYDIEKWFRYDPDTGKAVLIPLPKKHGVIDWSRDGKWLLTWIILPREGGHPTSRLARIPIAGGEPEFLTPEKVQTLAGRLSPDGTKLLFTSERLDDGERDGRYRLYVMDLKDRKPVQVADPANGDVAGLGCCWSPDGKRIAYVRSKPFWTTKRDDEGCNFAVIVANADGSNPKVVAVRSVTGNHAISSAGLSLADWR